MISTRHENIIIHFRAGKKVFRLNSKLGRLSGAGNGYLAVFLQGRRAHLNSRLGLLNEHITRRAKNMRARNAWSDKSCIFMQSSGRMIQRKPVLEPFAHMMERAARLMSHEGSIQTGFLPPNSSTTGVKCWAAAIAQFSYSSCTMQSPKVNSSKVHFLVENALRFEPSRI